jgi:hypothetical protein
VAATAERRCVHCGDVIAEGEGVEAKALMVMGPDGKETWFSLSQGSYCCSPDHALKIFGGASGVAHDLLS